MALWILNLCIAGLVVMFLAKQGTWTAVLAFINVVLSGLVATSYFEPTAAFVTEYVPSGFYLWDFIFFWLIFAIVMGILRGISQKLSKVRVKFPKALDIGGGIVFALATAWIVVCLLMMTIHIAPLAREPVGGHFIPEERMLAGTAPDRQWLGFMQWVSRGSLAVLFTGENANDYVFDVDGKMMPMYAIRRTTFEEVPGIAAPQP